MGNVRRSVVVIGDIMLDRYLQGTYARQSQEADVPILRIDKGAELTLLGGAGNVAAACAGLGFAEVHLCGYLGGDANGASVLTKLRNHGIVVNLVAINNRARTTTKTRVLSDGAQLCRLDEEDIAVDYHYARSLLERLDKACHYADVIIVSDYNKGAVTGDVLAITDQYHDKVFLDPKPGHIDLYREHRFAVIKPNRGELFLMAPEANPDISARKLSIAMDCNVVATLGNSGVVVAQDSGRGTTAIPGKHVEVVDSIGAGDIFMAAMAYRWANNGEALTDAARWANAVAAASVAEKYTAIPSMESIRRMGRSDE